MTTTESSPRDRIVVGVDGSKSSEEALRWARFMAGVTGSPITAVAAWHEATGAAGMAAIAGAALPADRDPAAETARMLADTLGAVLGDGSGDVETSVREGSAAKVLLEASDGARMLVVGSRGHGGFTGLLLGSVSTACAEHASCPVLVIHGYTPPPPLG